MGSVPTEQTDIGTATNGPFLQVRGAPGVAIIAALVALAALPLQPGRHTTAGS
jgi:hypothetical protein